MRIARFVLLKSNTSKETWWHYLSWQVGGEFCRRYIPHSPLEMRCHCLVLVERWRVSLLSGWAPAGVKPWTSPELWYSVLSLWLLYLLFIIPAFLFTQVSVLYLASWAHSALYTSLPFLLWILTSLKICIRHYCIWWNLQTDICLLIVSGC